MVDWLATGVRWLSKRLMSCNVRSEECGDG